VGANVREFLGGGFFDLFHRDTEDHILVGKGVVSVEAGGGFVHPDDHQRNLGATRVLSGHHVTDIHIRRELGFLDLKDPILVTFAKGVVAGDGHGLTRAFFEPIDGGFEGRKKLAGAVQVPHGPDPTRRIQRITLAVGELEIKGHDTSLTDVLHTLDGFANRLFVVVVIVASTTAALAATAGLGLIKGRATVSEIEFDRFSDRLGVSLVVNGDPDLLESGKRTLAHAAGEEDLDVVFFEEPHRRHTPTVLVGDVIDRGDLTDGPIRQRHQGEDPAVAEVLGNGGVHTTGSFRRNGNQHTNPLSRPAMVLLRLCYVESSVGKRGVPVLWVGARITDQRRTGMGGISDVRFDAIKNRLYITISGFFRQSDVPGSMQKLEQALTEVRPDFDTITDLSGFVPGAPGASDALAKGGAMIKEKGRRRGVRITGGLMTGLLQFQRLLKGVFDEENTRYAKSMAEAESILDNWEDEA